MFSNYIYVEIKQILRTRFALLLLLSLVFFTGFAIWNGVQSLAQKRTSIKNITAKHQEKLQTMKMAADSIIRNSIVVERWWIDPSNPLVIGEFGKGGMPIMIEPSAVSAIATGVSDLQKDVQLTYMTYTKNFSTVNDFENPINLTFGSFDLTFVLVFLLPLFVIALNYDLISSEREQGTLALLLSQPLNSKRIFLFKTLSKFFIIALIISALLFPLLLFIGIKSNTIFPYAIVFATLVYTLFWFVLSFLINLFNQSSAFNALACIGLWLLLVVIVPTQLSMVSELAYPIPSRAALMNEIRQFDVAFEANKEAILIDYFQKNSQYTRKPIAEQDAFVER